MNWLRKLFRSDLLELCAVWKNRCRELENERDELRLENKTLLLSIMPYASQEGARYAQLKQPVTVHAAMPDGPLDYQSELEQNRTGVEDEV